MAKKKKRCEKGMQCPYIHEYQHQLEFFHQNDDDKAKEQKSKKSFTNLGRGRKVGRNRSSKNAYNPYESVRERAAKAAEKRSALIQKNNITPRKCEKVPVSYAGKTPKASSHVGEDNLYGLDTTDKLKLTSENRKQKKDQQKFTSQCEGVIDLVSP